MARMSPLHSPTAGLEPGISIAPISVNGDTPNVLNGTTIDLRGRGGVVFTLLIGALTGTANVAAHLQTSDLPTDPANGNWTNVNTTTYPNATLAASTSANSAGELSYVPVAGLQPNVRVVRTVAANVALSSISHVIYG
jgi:hypothetical protein